MEFLKNKKKLLILIPIFVFLDQLTKQWALKNIFDNQPKIESDQDILVVRIASFAEKMVKNGQKSAKFVLGKSTRTFSSEGVLTQMRVLINSTQLDLQNKTGLRQKYLSQKIRSTEYS